MIPKLRQWLRGEPPLDDARTVHTRVLMVCTGNICRSPTAEGVLRHKLQRAGLGARVRIDSAGTQGYHSNEPPDPRAVKAAAQRGYDLSGLRARPLRPDDFAAFDLLLAMDQTHQTWMLKRAPAPVAGKVKLLMPYARRHPDVVDVPDPYFGGPAGFEHVLDLVEDACDGLVERLQAGAPQDGAREPGNA